MPREDFIIFLLAFSLGYNHRAKHTLHHCAALQPYSSVFSDRQWVSFSTLYDTCVIFVCGCVYVVCSCGYTQL